MSAKRTPTDEPAREVLRRLVDGIDRGDYDAKRRTRSELRRITEAVELLESLPLVTVTERLR